MPDAVREVLKQVGHCRFAITTGVSLRSSTPYRVPTMLLLLSRLDDIRRGISLNGLGNDVFTTSKPRVPRYPSR